MIQISKKISYWYKVFRMYYQKVLKMAEKWVEYNIWQFLEQFGHLLGMIEINSFLMLRNNGCRVFSQN